MITLQSTFSYSAGEVPPVQSARIVFQYPVLNVTVLNTTTLETSLDTIGKDSLERSMVLTSKTYSQSIPTSEIFGSDYGNAASNWLFWLWKRDNSRPKLDDISITFSVNYLGEETDAFSFDTLWFLMTLKDNVKMPPLPSIPAPQAPLAIPLLAAPAEGPAPPAQGPRLAPPAPAPAPAPAPGPNDIVDKAIYAVNKKVYKDFLTQLFPGITPDKESVLLFIINILVDLTGSAPTLAKGKDAVQRQTIQDLLKRFELPVNDNAFNYVSRNFSKLFDFPIQMPKIKLLTVAGALRVRKLANGTVPKANWDFYHLSSEYNASDTRSTELATYHTSQYMWDPTVPRRDDRIDFTFSEKYPRSRISGPVTVKLKAFDGSDLYAADFQAIDPALMKLDIVVEALGPSTIVAPGSGPVGLGANKLRGKVVSFSKSCTLKGVVVIEAQVTTGGPWIVVSTGTSDKDGNFTIPYPYGTYIAARARVSLSSASVTPLQVTSNKPSESISSDFIFILLQDTDGSDGKGKVDDCNCNPSVTAGRLPSHDDLMQSNQYTQDIGGSCIKLSVPNRTLREFNYHAIVRHTDPDVANYTVRSETTPSTDAEPFPTTIYYIQRNGKVHRKAIDLDNPVDWQDVSAVSADLEIYQAVTVATGHILYYKSEFKADGYSLGDLVYSLPLAPGQKREIVTIDSAHSFLGAETQGLTQSEQLANNLLSERNVVDQIGGNVSEALSGSSSASTAGISAGLGAAGSTGALGASLGVAGGYSNAHSDASQNSSRNLSQFFSEQLRQGLQQNASSYRQMNATAVTAVQEGQHYSATTDVVANHNHCHSMTMMYFEVLRHFAIFQELVDVEECVFVPLLMTRFTMENISKWADALAPSLLTLHSNTYLKPATYGFRRPAHPLLPAFDAIERVRTNWKMVDYPTGRYCDEPIEWVEGELTIVASIPRPNTKYDNILSLPVTTKTVYSRVPDFHQGMKDVALSILTFGLGGGDGTVEVSRVVETRAKIFDAFMLLDENFAEVPPAQCIRIKSFNPISPVTDALGGQINLDPINDFFANEDGAMDMWLGYSELLGYGNKVADLRRLLTKYFQMQLIGDWDRIWFRQIAPEIFTKILGHIQCDISTSFDTTQLNKFTSAGEQVVPVAFTAQASVVRSDVHLVKLFTNSTAAQKLSQTQMVFRVRSMRMAYSTAHYNGMLFNGTMNGDLLDTTGAICRTPLKAAEKVNPRQDDKFLTQRLITHLNQNLEYYNRVLWFSLDANRRFLLLDGFQIETFNKFGGHEGFRSLSSVLKNTLITVAGNSLVFPVAPGYRVSQALIVSTDGEGEQHSESLLDHYLPDEPQSPYRISVPTRGVFCEAILGDCDACEKVQPDSSQDWTQFKTDEPTTINAITAPVPTITPYNPTLKDFSQPMVQIQNAPVAPDPGVGLKAITDLMGKSNIFKDITGLDGNQQNAMQTYLSNQENVRELAHMATGLVNQSHNTVNSGRIMSTIGTGHAQGALTDEERNQLVKDHAQQMIDGGTGKAAELAKEKATQKAGVINTVTKAAVDQNRDMTLALQDSDGSQTASLKSNATQTPSKILADVSGVITPLQQARDTCWAAVATMMLSWQRQVQVDIETAVRMAGEEFGLKYQAGQALSASNKQQFIDGMGMVSEAGASYPYSQYVKWIQTYGPLWVTVDANTDQGPWSLHAVLLIRIEGNDDSTDDNTYFTSIDPATGKSIRVSFTEFRKSLEQAVTDADPRFNGTSEQIALQIVHFPQDIQSKEGYAVGFYTRPPVHENLVLQGLRDSTFKLNSGITPGSDPATNEFLRGVFWNDDPANELWDLETKNNWNKSGGALWTWEYKQGENASGPIPITNIIGRSHFGDLQFLHCMATAAGEAPTETFAKVMMWVEIMYRMATLQGYSETTKLVDVPTVRDGFSLLTFFDAHSRPNASQTLKDLIAPLDPYTGINMKRRALGSLLHTIQDSYAKGHTRRTLLNSSDLADPTKSQEVFKPGSWAQLGDIEIFHTYKGQGAAHSQHDTFDVSNIKTIDDWNGLWGARDAIAQSIKVIDFWKRGTLWNDGVKAWAESCFKVSASAKPSNSDV